MSLVVKSSSANAEDVRDSGLIPGSGRSPGGGPSNPLQYSCLENLMDRIPWTLATVNGVTKSQIQLKRLSKQTRVNSWFLCCILWCDSLSSISVKDFLDELLRALLESFLQLLAPSGIASDMELPHSRSQSFLGAAQRGLKRLNHLSSAWDNSEGSF